MKTICKPFVLAAAICAAGLGAAPAEAARVVIGVGVGVPFYGPGYWGPGYGPYYGAPYGYYGPRRIIVEQPVEVVQQAPAAPDPIFYPKSGQPPAQIETDRQQCNRWAAAQPNALADAGTFQRATYACMEGRDYSVR